MQVSAVIAAGGSGTRLGEAVPKQFLDLNGKPIIAWSLEAFSNATEIGELIIVAPLDHLETVKKYAKEYCIKKPYKVVHGGATRHESVKNGLQASSNDIKWVAVHDAARPFVTADEIDSICLLARELGAAIMAKKVIDTIKEVEEDIVIRTIDRNRLVCALTPQVCKKKDLFQAYEKAEKEGLIATDESSLLEYIGVNVAVQIGSSLNFKITTKEDLIIARAVARFLGDKTANGF